MQVQAFPIAISETGAPFVPLTERADSQQEFNEISTDRQMTMSERQAQEQSNGSK